jgi:glycosyltransferase involved in cell wall biosynthesis
MKIAIVGPAHPLRGGLATYNQRLARELQSQGHDVTIWSYSLQYPSFLFPGTTQYTDEPAPKDIHIRTAINSVNPINWLKVGNQMKRENYDLVIVRFWLPFMGPALGTILRRVKKGGHTHVLCIADNAIPHEKRPGDKQFTSYFLKTIDSFVTMSEKVKQDLLGMTAKRVTFLSHPLYDNFGEPMSKMYACKELNLPASDNYILFFGFIRKYKGLDILLEAMADGRFKNTNIKLIVAGEFYEDRKRYDELIEQNNLHERVKLFTDFIPDSRVRYFFSTADLVVQPYRNATQSGITQVAYHFEKPMVVTNVGGLPELVPDGKVGYVTEPDPGSIADAILKFYNDGPPERFLNNLQEEKKKYSWDYFTRQLLATAFGKH